ncbi:MAG: hypothetical protein WB680_22550 [Candidatus Acidiferrales bacterium]
MEWDDDPDVVSLEQRWQRWIAAKRLIDDDWKRDAERQVAAVTDEIETGLLLNRLDAERESNATADAAITERYFQELAAVYDRLWKRQAEKRLRAATKKINREIVQRERRLFHFYGR